MKILSVTGAELEAAKAEPTPVQHTYRAPALPVELTDDALLIILRAKAFAYFDLGVAHITQCAAVTILDYVESLEADAEGRGR